MPLERPTYAQIRQRYIATVETRLENADARLPLSDIDVTGHVVSEAASDLYDFGLRIADQILANTADVDDLEIIAADWDIYLKPAVPAAGPVTLPRSGTPGSVVAAGTRLQLAGQDYVVDADVVMVGASAEVMVTAALAGIAGNQPAGLSIALVSPIAGIAAKGVTGEISGGADAETPGQLLARLLQRMRRPPQGGNRDDFERWALQVPGITRAWAFKNTPRRGIVTLLVVRDGNAGSPIPAAGEVAEVQAHMDRPDVGPVCGECVVRAPTPKLHDVVIAIDPKTPEVEAAVEARVRAFYREEAAPWVTIAHSRLGAAVSSAAGEYRHKVTSPAADVPHDPFEMAVINSITFEPYGA